MDTLNKKIGTLIKNAILQSGKSQAHVARELKISPPSLSMMLAGKAPFPYKRFKEIEKIIPFGTSSATIEDLYSRKAISELKAPAPTECDIDAYQIRKEHFGADVVSEYREMTDIEKLLETAENRSEYLALESRITELKTLIDEKTELARQEVLEMEKERKKWEPVRDIITDCPYADLSPVERFRSDLVCALGTADIDPVVFQQVIRIIYSIPIPKPKSPVTPENTNRIA